MYKPYSSVLSSPTPTLPASWAYEPTSHVPWGSPFPFPTHKKPLQEKYNYLDAWSVKWLDIFAIYAVSHCHLFSSKLKQLFNTALCSSYSYF